MKRRNAECGKLRRPIKRNKITEGMYGSTTVLYMKFLILWAIVITADFMFMFRFEFLWPFWLLLRSVHDSFKYKGLAFSVLFVCIAITSDLVCLFFIPVHWLLFAASTYVWVQYVWHTDKGICLPTIILWMLFVYLEAFIRWKDSRHTPHLDLCRPFAAHCIGYPVVTLGFGFKSYVGYRMRQRKQKEVAKENDFYMQLLQQALPQEETAEETQMTAVNNTSMANNVTQSSNSSLTSSISTTASSLQSTAASIVSAVSSSFSSSSSALTAGVSTNGIVSAFASIANHAQHHLQQSNSQHNEHQMNNHHQHQNQQQLQQQHQNQNQHQQHHHHHHHHHLSKHSFNGANGFPIEHNEKTQIINSLPPHTDNTHNIVNAATSGHNLASTATATVNGHIGGGGSKSQRRSIDKESKNKSALNEKQAAAKEDAENQRQSSKNTNSYQNNSNNDGSTGGHTISIKDKTELEENSSHAQQSNVSQATTTSTPPTQPPPSSSSASSSSSSSLKEKDSKSSHVNSSKKTSQQHNGHAHHGSAAKHDTQTLNGSASGQQESHHEAVVHVVEKPKGKRNRAKKDTAKDNQSNNNNSNNNNNNNVSQSNNNHQTVGGKQPHNHQSSDSSSTHSNNHVISDASSVSSASSTTSSLSTSSTLSQIASKVVSKVCESCLKFEADIKKYRSEISHMKQIENELRQKLEVNMTNKSCLQAKQKECEELEKRIQELSNARHADMLQLQTAERRLTEERRQKQSLDAQLNNEKKARKLAEERAARPECSTQCKQRKQQMDEEIKSLRRELKSAEEAKLQAEQHGRKIEQELRLCEQEIRTRDSKATDTEMLMNALATLQDQNCTLEKNLSAETRVKLDLFSALGDAKRQLEICEGRRRSKEEEVLDLKAKIAQLIALLPSDSLCLSSCGPSGATAMLRMNDTPPLQAGPGPASPMLSSLSAQQVSNRSVPNDFVQQVSEYCSMANSNGPVSQHVPVSVATSLLGGNAPSSLVNSGHSGLDPNASIYKPKSGQNCSQVVGVVVGGAGDA